MGAPVCHHRRAPDTPLRAEGYRPMSDLSLVRLTGFAGGRDDTGPEVWVNPGHIAYRAAAP